MTDDTVQTYLVTVKDEIRLFCPTCDQARPVFVGQTKAGDILTGCCFCQRVLSRTRVPELDPVTREPTGKAKLFTRATWGGR